MRVRQEIRGYCQIASKTSGANICLIREAGTVVGRLQGPSGCVGLGMLACLSSLS